MITDPISDMLTQIRNAQAVKKTEELPGRIKMLQINLKYDGSGSGVISGLKRVSKPGQRIYSKAKTMPRSALGIGTSIVSTSHGLMTTEEARKAKVGGELICQIW